MPLSPNQIAQLRQVLQNLSAANSIASVPGGPGKALEAWVFMALADAANRIPNWRVTLRQGDGSPLPAGGSFLFCGGPSSLPRVVGDACFAQIERVYGAPLLLELHHGLQHVGRSNARHEWDIALLPQQIADHIRLGNGTYPRGLPFLGIECKDKSSSGDANEMRQTLARMFDLAHVSQLRLPNCARLMSETGAFGIGRRWPSYAANFSNGYFGIVRVGGFQLGARQISDYYSIGQVGQINQNTTATLNALASIMTRVLSRIDRLY